MRPYYEHAGITIYHGDCREILPTLPTCHAVVTDPPYGIDLQPPRGKTAPILNDLKRDAQSLWWSVVPLAHRLLADNSASIFFGAWSERWAADVLAQWFDVKNCIAWDKGQFGIGYYLRPQWELAWYCHKGTPPVPAKADSNVWRVPRIQSPEHSCEKPVALMRRAVAAVNVPPNGCVLDLFSGVGATLIAAKECGYGAIGIEIEERYCEIAAKRLQQEVLPLEVTA